MIDGGWLDFECIYTVVLFGFLKGKFFPVVKLKETSKKSVSMRFVSIVIHSPSSLNKLIMSFLNLSILGALALCIMASPSSQYKLTLLEPKRDLILFRRYNPTNHFLLQCSLSLSERQTLVMKISDVEISMLDQNKNWLCYTLLFGSSLTLKTLAYSLQQLNTSYQQKDLTFLFK